MGRKQVNSRNPLSVAGGGREIISDYFLQMRELPNTPLNAFAVVRGPARVLGPTGGVIMGPLVNTTPVPGPTRHKGMTPLKGRPIVRKPYPWE